MIKNLMVNVKSIFNTSINKNINLLDNLILVVDDTEEKIKDRILKYIGNEDPVKTIKIIDNAMGSTDVRAVYPYRNVAYSEGVTTRLVDISTHRRLDAGIAIFPIITDGASLMKCIEYAMLRFDMVLIGVISSFAK